VTQRDGQLDEMGRAREDIATAARDVTAASRLRQCAKATCAVVTRAVCDTGSF
jgi:hypothetical protein